MKQGIIYGGAFLFTFVIVTGVLIYLNSTYENIFQFNFAPKSQAVKLNLPKTDSLRTEVVEEMQEEPKSITIEPKDSILLSSMGDVTVNDTAKIVKDELIDKTVKNNLKEDKDIFKSDIKSNKTEVTSVTEQLPIQQNSKPLQGKEYEEWISKVTSIYSAMEPKKAAKIIQTYSDNVARDILYNMNKKTAAKVVSEFSPETANRIFRYE